MKKLGSQVFMHQRYSHHTNCLDRGCIYGLVILINFNDTIKTSFPTSFNEIQLLKNHDTKSQKLYLKIDIHMYTSRFQRSTQKPKTIFKNRYTCIHHTFKDQITSIYWKCERFLFAILSVLCNIYEHCCILTIYIKHLSEDSFQILHGVKILSSQYFFPSK